jgi:hypothetical protein
MAFSDLFKKKKDSKSPSKAGAEGGTEGSISADIVPFLNIIAKNSLALPGMARDMNVLRQNIVKLVKLKNAEAITKADKFFKTEDKREAELEDARKKEKPTQVKINDSGKSKKEDKSSGEEGIAEYLFNLIGKTLAVLFLGIGAGIVAAFDLGKLIDTIKDKLNPMPMIEGLFESIKGVWKQITESDIIAETLIKGVGKFLDFITSGLFGEKELRESMGELKEYVAPMIDVLTIAFTNIGNWMADNLGWDSFTIPLSKYLPDAAKQFGITLPDITVPGFRPFKKKAAAPAAAAGGGGAPPAAAPAAAPVAAPAALPVDQVAAAKEVTPAPTEMPSKEKLLGKMPGGLKDFMGMGGDNPELDSLFKNAAAIAEQAKKYQEKNGKPGDTPTSPAPMGRSPYTTPTEPAVAATKSSVEAAAATPTPAPAAAPAPAPAAPTPVDARATLLFPKNLAPTAGDSYNDALKFMKYGLGILPDGKGGYKDMPRFGDKTYSEEEVKRKIKAAGNPDPDKVLGLLNQKPDGSTLDISSKNVNTVTGGAVGGGAGTSPMPISPPSGGSGGGGSGSPPASGAALSSASSEVAEGQRMDSAASAGVTVDAGTTNNTSGSTGQKPKQIADTYNASFVNSYYAKPA